MPVRYQGLAALKNKFKKIIAAGRSATQHPPEAVVGYTAPYAHYVHEDQPSAKAIHRHEPPTCAKFLEIPARRNREELAQVFVAVLKESGEFGLALRATSEALKEMSLHLCPIDTGRLRESAFVRIENPDCNLYGGG